MNIPTKLYHRTGAKKFWHAVNARPEVRWFAELMEQKLKVFDTKLNWEDMHPGYALRRLHEEFDELRDLLVKDSAEVHTTGADQIYYSTKKEFSREAVIEEAVDLANFAMMIADVCRKDLEK